MLWKNVCLYKENLYIFDIIIKRIFMIPNCLCVAANTRWRCLTSISCHWM